MKLPSKRTLSMAFTAILVVYPFIKNKIETGKFLSGKTEK